MALPSLTSLLLGEQYLGVEHFSLNAKEMIAILLIEKKKDELVITKKDKVSYTNIIPEKWNKKLPFFIVVNTNQVVQKEIASIDATDEKLLHKAFPNTNWNDFYFEIWRLKTKSIIAISRKGYIDELLSDYRKQGIPIAGISLGVSSVAELTTYKEESEMITNNQIISWTEENQAITTKTEDLEITYNINGLSIKNSQLLAFSGILRLLFNSSNNTGNILNYSQELYGNFNQQSFFSKGIKIIIGTLFLILLFNSFAFMHYYKLAEASSENLLLSKSSVEDIFKTKERIRSKEEKIKSILATTASQSSIIINEIAKKIPQSILLTELIYHPIEKKIKTEEPILSQEKVIIISGTTINNDAFTIWIEAVEQLKWIDQVLISRFGKNDLNETEFSIKITLK